MRVDSQLGSLADPGLHNSRLSLPDVDKKEYSINVSKSYASLRNIFY